MRRDLFPLIVAAAFICGCGEDNSTAPDGSLENTPPEVPRDPVPAHGEVGVDTSLVELAWTCSDPDGDSVTCTVHWDTTKALQDSIAGLVTHRVTIEHLRPGSHYYWKVVAKDEEGRVTQGPIWEFHTVELSILVSFVDPTLEAAVRDSVNKPQGDIYSADLVDLTTLVAESSHIVDLSGIEYMTSLTTLYLNHNDITDLAPLAGLPALRFLALSDNRIEDLAPLQGLTSLQLLGLSENQIQDIQPLQNLTELSYLNLSQNLISDLESLRGLTKLATLALTGNQIDDITPLGGLTSLSVLYLDQNQIAGIGGLGGLRNLARLTLNYNLIADISPIADLTMLNTLDLYGNQISSVSPLSGLVWLSRLNISGNLVADISPLGNLRSLTSLNLTDNQVRDIQPLVSNSGIGDGDYVYLRSNPLDVTSRVDHIPMLQQRGVTVIYDPE